MVENHEISKQEVTRILSDAGYQKSAMKLSSNKRLTSNKHIPMLKGRFSFNQLPSGINLHCTDVIEDITGKNTTEIFDGISINFLISGKIDFALDGDSYHVSAHQEPITFISLIKESALFTRFFNEGEEVRKVNLCASKKWLYKHAKSQQDKTELDSLFTHKQAVHQWPMTRDTFQLVAQLFALKEQAGIASLFRVEQIAFQLFGQCYEQLNSIQTPSITPIKNDYAIENPDERLYEDQLEKILYEPFSLGELSIKLGASISTLQRYFKAKHQVTVKEYIRNQKLEHARRSLVFDNKSIGEVAYDAGYIHVSNFIIAFKKYFLMTPSELKGQYKHC